MYPIIDIFFFTGSEHKVNISIVQGRLVTKESQANPTISWAPELFIYM